MDYYKYCFQTEPAQVEILMALLSLQAFESFEETSDGFNAFIPANAANSSLDENLSQTLQDFKYHLEKVFIPYQNWNKIWESNFDPIVIRDFCGIRANFHAPIPNVKHELVINPKMAFGTGHHETTHMVSDRMESIDFKQKKVLDFGCGTGILSILAAYLGASKIDAVDIELPSFENTVENARINNVDNINAIHGTLDNINDKNYDIILANINRNVILDSISTLYHQLKPQGILVVSGFMLMDEDILKETATQNNFIIDNIKRKNQWICMEFHRN